MKMLITAAIFLIIPQICLADGWGDLSGKDKNGNLIYIFPADSLDYRIEDDSVLVEILFYKGGSTAANNAKKIVGQRCILKNDKSDRPVAVEFSCVKSGKSPMSGTVYKIVPNKDPKDCSYEFMYICTHGCDNPAVPQRMYKSYWECSE